MAVVAAPASAQSTDAGAMAEQLFNQARELVKANHWQEACPKFEASLRYDPVLGTRLNLATCYEHTGKLASAWGLYREAIELATKAGDRKRRDYAQKQAAAIEPRLATLIVSAPAAPLPGLVITRDGTPLDAGALGAALYVDAGPHDIRATAPGYQAFTQTVTAVDAKAESVVIPALVAEPAPAVTPVPEVDTVRAAPVAPEAASATRDVPRGHRRSVAIAVGAAGVAVVATGLIFGAKASSTYDDAKSLCGAQLACAPASYARGQQLIDDVRTRAATSTVLVAVGGAAIAASAILWLTAPHAPAGTTARIVPIATRQDAGVAVLGSF